MIFFVVRVSKNMKKMHTSRNEELYLSLRIQIRSKRLCNRKMTIMQYLISDDNQQSFCSALMAVEQKI